MAEEDYSLIEDKTPWDDIVANYDDEQLIKEGNVKDVTFLSLSAKENRTEQEQALYAKLKTSIYRAIVLNSTDDKDKYGGHWGNEIESDYYFSNTRRYKGHTFSDWKIHLDVKPTPKDPVTKEISEFLKTLDVEHKIAHGGIEGKGMTIYTGSYADTRRLSRIIYERFHDKMKLPPIYDNITNEHFFNPYCFGRFQDGGQPFPMEYPVHTSVATGISGFPSFSNMVGDLVDKELDDVACIKLCHLYVKNANENGLNLPDFPAPPSRGVRRNPYYKAPRSKISNDNKILFHTLASYSLHKLWADELGDFYHGGDLDKFEKIFFKGYLPEKGTPEREKWDKTAEANIKIIRENCGDRLQLLKDKVAHYIPIDFSRIEENTNQPQTQNLENTQQQPATQLQQTPQDRQQPAPTQNDTQNTGRTTMAENNNTTAFQNLEQLFTAFHEIGEAQYETGAVTNEELARFAEAKEDYLRRNPQEREQVNADIERFLNNDLENGRASQSEMFGGFTYTFDEAFRDRYHTVEEETLKNMPPYFENRDQLFIAFHEIGEAQYTAVVSDEEITRFIAAKEEYLRRNPQEREEIDGKIDRFLQNLDQEEMFGNFPYIFNDAEMFRKHFHELEEDYRKPIDVQPIQEQPTINVVKETRRVPDLAQSVLQMGFNNQGIEDRLRAVVRELPDGHEKEMFSKVLEAYVERNNAHTVNAPKVVALNDLIVNEADIEIAKRITATLGWWEGDYPETDREIEVQRTVVEPPVHIIDDPRPQPEPEPDPRPQPVPEPEPHPEPDPRPQPVPEPMPVILEDIRIRSHDNFDNESAMYRIELAILAEQKLIPEDEAQKAIDAYTKLMRERDIISGLTEDEARNFVSNVSAEDLAAGYELVNKGREKVVDTDNYKKAIVGRVLDAALAEGEKQDGDNVWFNLLTPELTATGIDGLYDSLGNPFLKDEERPEIERRFNLMLEYGENLLSDLTNKQGYYFTDITNAADEYDGYMHLADVCEKIAKEKNKGRQNDDENTKRTTIYDTARNLMKEYIKPYDELYNIPSDEACKNNPKDITIDLNDRFNKASQIIEKLEFDEDNLSREYLEAMQNYKFVSEYDTQGNPTYEKCIEFDDNGKMKVVKGSSLETALKFAANEAIMQNLGNFSRKMDKDLITEGAKDNAFNTLFAYANSEDVVKKGLQENPHRFTDPKYVEEFKQKLMNGEEMEISPLGAKLALDRQANNVETFGNRLTSKLGKENTEYLKAGLLGQIKKIDKTSRYHDGSQKVKEKALKRNILGAGLGFGIATLASYATTKLSLGSFFGMSKTLPIAGGFAAELSIGGVNAAVGAVAGAAVSTLSYLAVKKISASLKKEKYGWKEIKKDFKSPQFRFAVCAGALGGASVGFALSGCPKCAMACGAASIATASAGRFYTPYRDMRLHGYGRVKSAAMGIVNAAAVALGGKLGHDLASSGNHVEVTADEKQAKDLYKDLDQAKKDGWNFEESNEPKEGFTLLREENGPEYHQYSEQEMAWANKRSDGIRFSEFLNGGKGGLHVDPDYQNGLGGLNHDQVLHDNAIKALNEAASQPGNEWMNTLTDGKANPNSEMLLYKVYQMRVLAPNENTPLADGSQTVGDFFKADNDHTYSSLYEKLLNGKSLDKLDLQVLSKIEDHVGGQLDDKVNDLGKIIDVKGATHPQNAPVDSFNDQADKGYDLLSEKSSLFGRFTKSMEAVTGFGATILSWPKKVKDFLRPGAKADRTDTIEKPQGGNTIIPPQETPDKGDTDKQPTKPENTDGKTSTGQDIKPQTVDVVKINRFLNEEYQMLYGYKPTQDDKQYQAYCKRVEEELKAEPQGKDMLSFLKERRQEIDDVVEASLSGYLGSDKGQKDLKHLQGYGDHLPETSKVLKDFNEKHANSPLTNAIRQDFWQNKNKPADEWRFDDYVKSAENYLKRTDKDLDRDAKKAPLRRIDGAKPKGRG